MKKIIVCILLICMLFAVGVVSNAASSISLTKFKDTILAGEQISITVNYPDNTSVADYTLTFDNSVFTADISQLSNYVDSAGDGFIKVVDTKNKSLTIVFSANSSANGTYKFGLKDIVLYDDDAHVIPADSNNLDVVVRQKSSDATLQSLTVNGESLDANQVKHSVTVPYNATNVTILAEKALYGNKVEGTGSKSLTGKTTSFNVVSYAEDGTSKNYEIVVTKSDALESKLDSLSINGTDRDVSILKHVLTCNNDTRISYDSSCR